MARKLDKAKRETILKAAKTILLREGYAAAKMSDIASEAGVAPGTLYLYFESKESLAAALAEDCLNRLTSQFISIISKLESPEGIEELMNWSLGIGTHESDVFAMMRLSKQDPKSPRMAREKFVQELAETLKDLMSRGLIREYENAVHLANVILAIVTRLIMSCSIYKDADPEGMKAAAVKALEHALFDDAMLKRYRAGSRNKST